MASATEPPVATLTADAGAFVCENYHIQREPVLETDCIWLSSAALVSRDIAEGRIIVLQLADFSTIHSNVSLIVRQGRTSSPAAMAVVDHVRALIASIGE